jgi:uroporphyrinogen decarboxylase
MGLRLSYEKGEGPIIHNPLRSAADVGALAQPDPRETVAYTLEAVRLVKRELAGKIPLIGFSGAPFTLASYAIEGGSSREYRHTKRMMYAEPQLWHALMAKLTNLVAEYALAQLEAGADAIQIFDSWAGALSPGDYAEYVLPYVQQAIAAIRDWGSGIRDQEIAFTYPTPDPRPPTPVIYFGTGMSGMLGLLRQSGADVLGVDWRIYLDEAWAQIGPQFAVQGNLDPHALFAPWPEIERRAADILRRAAGHPGHIFNLGHGILTETPVENVARLAEFVHEHTI